MDLLTLFDRVHSEERCVEYLEGLRWPKGVRCPRVATRVRYPVS